MSVLMGVLCVLAFTFVGIGISSRLSAHVQLCKGGIQLCEAMERELHFSKRSFQDVLLREVSYDPLKISLEHFFALRPEERTEVRVRECCANLCASEEECALLIRFFLGLGRSDSAAQLLFLAEMKEEFRVLFERAEGKRARYAPLCVRLGFLVGSGAMVLLI